MVYNGLTFTQEEKRNEKEKRDTDLACTEILLTGNSKVKVRHIFLSIRNTTSRRKV